MPTPIKTEDLRVGNYIVMYTIDNPDIFDIHIVEPATLMILSGEVENKNLGLKPIPLTEEWLLKFGFVERDRWFYKKKFLLGYMTTDNNLQAEWRISGAEGAWNLINITSVHQLQNLYHALTGQELTLKE